MTLLALEGRPQPLKVKKANFSENRNAINHTKTSEHKQSVKRLWNISVIVCGIMSAWKSMQKLHKNEACSTQKECVCAWAAAELLYAHYHGIV